MRFEKIGVLSVKNFLNLSWLVEPQPEGNCQIENSLFGLSHIAVACNLFTLPSQQRIMFLTNFTFNPNYHILFKHASWAKPRLFTIINLKMQRNANYVFYRKCPILNWKCVWQKRWTGLCQRGLWIPQQLKFLL